MPPCLAYLTSEAGHVDSTAPFASANVEENGTLWVATAPYQAEDLREHFADLQRFGAAVEWFNRDAVRAQVDSPTYFAGVWIHRSAIIDPARLCWGLRDAILRLGVRLYEGCPVEQIRESSDHQDHC